MVTGMLPADYDQRIFTAHSIFVVDDDHFLNELFCHFLQSKGFSTQSSYSLVDAISIIERGKVTDLILLDYNLGDGNGLEFLGRLKQVTGDAMPPVIMVSNNEDSIFLETCFAAGVADYVIKPVNLSLLALKVSSLIRSVSLQRLIRLQNSELERFKQDAEREEAVAKFTYEYLLRHNSHVIQGVNIWLKPSRAFSGDIAIAKLSPGGDLYFLLADATGHGLSAAITVMPVVSIFNTMVGKGFGLQPIVIEMNRKLVRDTPHDRFVAAVIVHVERERNEIHVWNGGMPTAYWIIEGALIKQFKSQHMALGILEDDQFDANVDTWCYGSEGCFFTCSDGLLEEVNAQGECFSKERLLNIIEKNPNDLQREITSELERHSGKVTYQDDVSICILTPEKLLGDKSGALIKTQPAGFVEEESSDFFWQIRITGKKLSNCELAPLCNKFLQYVGVNHQLCQVVFLVVSEMVSNALDHGILRMDSRLKEEADGFNRYFREREKRLSQLTDSDAIELTLHWETTSPISQLRVRVVDSGAGYSMAGYSFESDALFSGRGLRFIRQLSRHVKVYSPGNWIEAIIRVN